MQIRPTSVRLVRLNFGLSLYLDRTFRLSLSLSLSLSRKFGLRPKFRLSERLSEIASFFDLSLVLDRTLAQRKAERKAKSKSEVAHWPQSVWPVVTLNGNFMLNSVFMPVCLALVIVAFKDINVQTNKDRPVLSVMQVFSRDSSFWRCKVYADIRGGSLERRHQVTVRSCINAHAVCVA